MGGVASHWAGNFELAFRDDKLRRARRQRMTLSFFRFSGKTRAGMTVKERLWRIYANMRFFSPGAGVNGRPSPGPTTRVEAIQYGIIAYSSFSGNPAGK
jgi:hypothetical protein